MYGYIHIFVYSTNANMLSNAQSAFRPKLSTTLLDAQDFILKYT